MQQITIGRDPRCTIVVDARYDTVSSNHATLIAGGGGIQLEDHSSNGTYVNGRRIYHSTIQISDKDKILLSNTYELKWQDINKILLNSGFTVAIPQKPRTRRIEEQNHAAYHGENTLPLCYENWNWGAFCFGIIWSTCHKLYWPLLCLIPIIGLFAYPVILFILGANGNKYAWEKYQHTATEFDIQQRKWSKAAGIVCLIILLLLVLTACLIVISIIFI